MPNSLHTPLVSICIPCYNTEAYVQEALQSILDQTYQNLEVIVVDDNSTDNTLEKARTFSDSRLKIIENKEIGSNAAKARNRALSMAKGEYVKFFDADDILSSEAIESQVELLMENDAENVASSQWGRFHFDDVATFELDNPNQTVWRDMPSNKWLIESFMNARPMMQPGVFLIPRRIIEKAGGWDESLTLIDDFEFFTRVLTHCKTVRFCEGATLYYRSNVSGSLSGTRDRNAVVSAYNSLMKGVSHLLKVDPSIEARHACANILQDFEYTYYPKYKDLRLKVLARVKELGGSSLAPEGSPSFNKLSKFIGWKSARRLQNLRRRSL